MGCLNKKIQEIIPSIKGELEVLKKHSKNESEDDLLDNEDKEAASEEQILLNETEELNSKSVDSGTSPFVVNLVILFGFWLTSTTTKLVYHPDALVIIGWGSIPS